MLCSHFIFRKQSPSVSVGWVVRPIGGESNAPRVWGARQFHHFANLSRELSPASHIRPNSNELGELLPTPWVGGVGLRGVGRQKRVPLKFNRSLDISGTTVPQS